jgi:CheY-like chemotaxis protein
MARRLLLAEDSSTIQRVVALSLGSEAYEIIPAASAEECLAKARQVRPDVVVLDHLIPRRNGYEVAQEIKRDPDLRSTPVLLLVGNHEAFDEKRAHDAGADDWLQKPFDSQALIDKLNTMLGVAPKGAEVTQVTTSPLAASRAAPPPVQPGQPLTMNAPWPGFQKAVVTGPGALFAQGGAAAAPPSPPPGPAPTPLAGAKPAAPTAWNQPRPGPVAPPPGRAAPAAAVAAAPPPSPLAPPPAATPSSPGMPRVTAIPVEPVAPAATAPASSPPPFAPPARPSPPLEPPKPAPSAPRATAPMSAPGGTLLGMPRVVPAGPASPPQRDPFAPPPRVPDARREPTAPLAHTPVTPIAAHSSAEAAEPELPEPKRDTFVGPPPAPPEPPRTFVPPAMPGFTREEPGRKPASAAPTPDLSTTLRGVPAPEPVEAVRGPIEAPAPAVREVPRPAAPPPPVPAPAVAAPSQQAVNDAVGVYLQKNPEVVQSAVVGKIALERPVIEDAVRRYLAAERSAIQEAVDAHLQGNRGTIESAAREAVQAQRGLIESVVWEVVPGLAETLIREEITRILREKTS